MQTPLGLSRLLFKSLIIAALGLGLALGVFYVNQAKAGTGLGVTPNFPTTVTVGDTNAPASLTIANQSTADEGTVTVSNVTLIPSCGNFTTTCTDPDPGVFSLSATGTGHTGTSCAGDTFTIAEINASTGQVSFTRNGGSLTLAFGASCTIDFTINVLKAPTKDALGDAGIQTAQRGSADGISALGHPADGTGSDSTTVNKASPTISTTPSAGGAIGTVLNDAATLSGGNSPAGNVTFNLYGPSDATCAGPALFTQTDTTAPYATTTGFTTTQAGTYRWTASYAGDANNNTATSGCQDEQVVISTVTPTVVTAIHNANHQTVTSGNSGDTLHDSATVSGSAGTATGDVIFSFFHNSTCTGDAAATSSAQTLSSGSVDATGFAQGPLASGSYSFMAHYNGAGNYSSANSACEPLTINQNQPSISTTLSATTVDVNTAVHDSATLTNATASAGGTVTYNVYSGTLCTGTPVFTSTVNVTNGSVANSGDFTPTAAGTYNWQAVYSGDANNQTATSACGTETLTVNQPVVQYCSPGYWKQSQHFGNWMGGYTPNEKFSAVFGETITIMWSSSGKPQPVTDPTLLQALQANGGGINQLARAAVDALLNAAALNSGHSTADVISAFHTAFTAGTSSAYQNFTTEFTAPENCPLGNAPAPAPSTSSSVSTASSNQTVVVSNQAADNTEIVVTDHPNNGKALGKNK